MILVDNIVLLKLHNSSVLNVMKQYEASRSHSNITFATAKNGSPNLVLNKENKDIYLHSRYDPENEARMFVKSLGDVSDYKHIFFYGLGMGHHIQAFFQTHEHIPFSVFEPNLEISYQFLCQCNLKQFPMKLWREMYLGNENMNAYIDHFFGRISDKVLLVALSSYERAFPDETEQFYERFKISIAAQKSSIQVNLGYEKLWVVNSVKNFPKVLATSSVLRTKKPYFQSKPAIIVSAGPSLQEEFETLRHIKENKLAYIFAVGSANKALLSQGIMPDALTTYDPNPWNHKTYEEIVKQQIQDIPLIFGSSVGHEIVETYPGPMLHMVTSQDPISHYYLNGDELRNKGEIVSDAPSIAVLTLEILAKLEVSLIVLVGQNFAFKSDQYYAQGVSYDYRSINLTPQEQSDLIKVEGVEGEQVNTFAAHNHSRWQMEGLVKSMPTLKVINTTRGGAKIAGTEYITLDHVIEQYLKEPVVDPQWHVSEPTVYDATYLKKQVTAMETMTHEFEAHINDVIKSLSKIDHHYKYKEPKLLLSILPKFDKSLKKISENDYFNIMIKPTMRVQVDMLNRTVPQVLRETDGLKKGKLILEMYGSFINDCQKVSAFCYPYYQELHSMLISKII